MTTGGDGGRRGFQSGSADFLAPLGWRWMCRDVAALPMIDCSATIVVAIGAFLRACAPAG
jgi:hypothetical protein